MLLLKGWVSNIDDVKGVFLHGKCKKGEIVYMKVPEVEKGSISYQYSATPIMCHLWVKTSSRGVLEGAA